MITEILSLMEGFNTAHDFYGKVSGIIRGDKDKSAQHLEKINENLSGIRLEFKHLSDKILYAPNWQSVEDVTRTQQQIITELREVRASLEPVQRALGDDIVSSAMILTPEKMQEAMGANPWDVLHNICPAHLARPHPDPHMVSVLFYHGGLQFIGWQMRGTLPILFNCRFNELELLPASNVRETRIQQPSRRSNNSLKLPEMVKIPAGDFMMGSNDYNWAKPIHSVTVKAFEMGKYAVTFEEYDRFCESTGRNKPSDYGGWGRGKRPVINVSWNDSVAYREWLSAQTGDDYRLPTEAEWEYACRAGSTSKWHFGDNDNKGLLGQYAWFGYDSGNSGKQTHPVGEKQPNQWGLYDMHGNVWEWTCSTYGSYGNGIEQRCVDKNSSENRILRGGSWYDTPYCSRSASRNDSSRDYSNYHFGFRIVRTLEH